MDTNVKIAIAGVAGLLVGGAAGYFAAREIEGRKAEHYINSEIQDANDYWKAHWKRVYAKPDIQELAASSDETEKVVEDKATLGQDWIQERVQHRDKVLSEMEDQVEEYDTTDENEPEEVITVEEKEMNIFEEAAKVQDPTVPRLISLAEFMEDAQDHDKISVTFFEGDGTMIDEKAETPIEDYEKLMGEEFASNFGKNSGDNDVVYVCNLAMEVDFEITRDPRTFEEWILGPMPKPGKKKMREDD